MASRRSLSLGWLLPALAFWAIEAPAQVNIAQDKPVFLVGEGFFVNYEPEPGVSPQTITDGVFLPRWTAWNGGTVWWLAWNCSDNDAPCSIEIDLEGTYRINGFVFQGDADDEYDIHYWDLEGESWQLAWRVPVIPGGHVQTRPDPADDSEIYRLPETVLTNRLRVTAVTGNWDAISEVQAFGGLTVASPYELFQDSFELLACVEDLIDLRYRCSVNYNGEYDCDGFQICRIDGWGPCELPEESCDAEDNDCDGFVDEDLVQPCYSGPPGTLDVGQCTAGQQLCDRGAWGVCVGEVLPEPETCDGLDNDCDPASPDGSEDPLFGSACDGADSDLCEEGSFSCAAGTLFCSDNTPGQFDVCDGIDNDCDPSSPDGSEDPQYGNACDGPDGDLCNEGTLDCSAGTLFCSDATEDNPDVCDGIDNDCDPSSPDGSEDPLFGSACDGADSDLCAEGTFNCTAGTLVCSDNTGDTLEVCDGFDNDCDGEVDEGC